MRRWEEVFTGADRALLQKTGFGVKQTFGNKPALIIIDVTRSFIGSKRQPVSESIKEYKTSCGEVGWVALSSIKSLLEACRSKHIPVIFTTGDPTTRTFLPGPTKIRPKPLDMADPRRDDIPEPIAPLPSELIIRKSMASGFFGTPLLMYLKYMEIDSLLISGTTTSGCVLATVIDAFSHGFRCFLVEECTFDRFELSHLVNLFDMNTLYADVITLEKALEYVDKVVYQS